MKNDPFSPGGDPFWVIFLFFFSSSCSDPLSSPLTQPESTGAISVTSTPTKTDRDATQPAPRTVPRFAATPSAYPIAERLLGGALRDQPPPHHLAPPVSGALTALIDERVDAVITLSIDAPSDEEIKSYALATTEVAWFTSAPRVNASLDEWIALLTGKLNDARQLRFALRDAPDPLEEAWLRCYPEAVKSLRTLRSTRRWPIFGREELRALLRQNRRLVALSEVGVQSLTGSPARAIRLLPARACPPLRLWLSHRRRPRSALRRWVALLTSIEARERLQNWGYR
ncbi:MAG: hypothetical protein VYD19_01285 [Myxococcota bacterium]|nr:hypothetical protein [Myxococcota bacterium]